MTPSEYRAILDALDIKQSGERSIAALMGVSGQAVRARLSGITKVSPAEQIVLRLMRAGRLTYEEAQELVD